MVEGERSNLEKARELLRAAIDLIDNTNAPGQIAAYVDMAQDQLQQYLAPDR